MRRRTEAAPAVATSVNLLSPWVHEDLRVRRWRERFGLGLLALLVLVAGAWAFQRVALAQAEADLRGEEATAASLQRRIADLAPVQAYVDGVDRRARTVQERMVTDVAFSEVLEALADATPAGARIESVSVELPATRADAGAVVDAAGTVTDPTRGLEAATCPGPDPFATLVVVGCLTLTGTADDRDSVGDLVRLLDRSRHFAEPFVSTTTTGDGAGVSFSGSVALDPKVFTGRYDDLAALTGLATDEEVDR